MSRGAWSGACKTGHSPLPAPRTTCRRKGAAKVPSFTLPLDLLIVRKTPKTCHRREAAPLWWYCHTQLASVRTSGVCVGSMKWRWSLSMDGHSAQCWPRWRTLYQWRRRPKWCTESHAVVARATLVQEKVGIPRGLLERDPGEVCSSEACMEGPPHHQMGQDHSGWRGQAPQGAAAQGSQPHPDDPSWGTPQQGHRAWASGCWVAALRRQEDSSTEQARQPLTDCAWTVIADYTARKHKNDTFPLRTIFILKKTGATWSKHWQDFRIHTGIGETVYPTCLSQLRSPHFTHFLVQS